MDRENATKSGPNVPSALAARSGPVLRRECAGRGGATVLCRKVAMPGREGCGRLPRDGRCMDAAGEHPHHLGALGGYALGPVRRTGRAWGSLGPALWGRGWPGPLERLYKNPLAPRATCLLPCLTPLRPQGPRTAPRQHGDLPGTAGSRGSLLVCTRSSRYVKQATR